MSMRLNRFLAQAGCGSRRACEELIVQGRVSLNGKVVTDLATQIEPSDHVKVGSRLLRNERTITAMLHKPKGYICTADDPEGRRTIFELLPKEWPRVFYVGRLDTDSEGLLLITNDGALGQRLTHPSYKLPKTYEVQLDREFDFTLADKLRKGLIVEGKKAKMDEVHKLGPVTLKVVLTQGIKRQIRMMFLILGYKVKRLVRTQIGGLRLGRLPAGQWDLLTEKDVENYFGASRLKAEPAPRSARMFIPKKPFRPKSFAPVEREERSDRDDRGDQAGKGYRPDRAERSKPPARKPTGSKTPRSSGFGGPRREFPSKKPFAPSSDQGGRNDRSESSSFRSSPTSSDSPSFRKPTGSRGARPGGPRREFKKITPRKKR